MRPVTIQTEAAEPGEVGPVELGRARRHEATAGSLPRAVAFDFDGTLTDDDRPSEDVLEALAAARAAGIRAVLVTGRILAELEAVFPEVADHFDAIVAENGVVVATPAGARCLGPEIHPQLARSLADHGVVVRRGLGILACRAADEHLVVDEVRRLGLEVQLVRNRSELMVVPSGLNKGRGLLHALAGLGLSAHDTLAVGDAENDHSLLAVAEVGVAVANAVPSLKEEADVVLTERDGAAVVLLLHEVLAGRGAWVRASRRFLTLGTDDDGDPVRLPARPCNLLIAGGTGNGKSYLAGLLAEQLIDLNYSVLVIDPEGDHVGLGMLRRAVVVGGDLAPPTPATVVSLLQRRDTAVVADLSGLPDPDRDRYLLDLPAEVEASRRATGRPHWVFVDEAASAVAREEAAIGAFEPAERGYCFITWQPERLPAENLAAVDTVLALTSPHPDDAVVEITAAVAGAPKVAVADLLTGLTGRVLLARRSAPGDLSLARVAPRVTGHFRHEHKYSARGMTADRRFWFRAEPDRLTGATAGNLGELEAELAHCDRAVLRHHAPRQDLSRWVAEVFHDQELADRIAVAEATIRSDSPAAVVDAGRLAMVAALHARRPG